MLKMLIVEDERWEREGLADFLDWNSLGIEVSGLACDGIEGLEQAKIIRPNIIITDIKMPGLDGLKMSGKVREFLPDVKIIVLTGYDDFKLAREAISISANAYILKPVEQNELFEVIKKVSTECFSYLSNQEENEKIKELLNKSIKKDANAIFLDILRGKANMHAIREQTFTELFSGMNFCAVMALSISVEEALNKTKGVFSTGVQDFRYLLIDL